MKILTLCGIVSLISASGAFNLEIFPSPLTVFVNEDVSLKCKVTDFAGAEIDLDKLGVKWTRNKETAVFSYETGNQVQNRPGAYISEPDLKRGNASLRLPKVQIADEGRYTCTVFIVPESAEQTSIMKVLARPNISISSHSITILNGSEGSLTCNVNGFYPQQLEISWVKMTKLGSEVVSSDCYTNQVVANSDNTFSVHSQLKIQPTFNNNGDKYRCVVRHLTFPDYFTIESTLTVPEPRNHYVIVASIICILAVVSASFIRYVVKLRGDSSVK
ncbi:natural cytotoxicity triggering receptor 3 ligand 1-like [Mobula hypostoma]|uniref:natural cytotoxicity triggering receptor 3 ligand 1-like n=1 Tax=Mobula hypostoma TaxID=723540 RepID=UPI002FC3714E